MAAQINELVIKYRSDISELQSKVGTLETTMGKVDKAAEKSGQSIKEAADKGGKSLFDLSGGIEDLGKKLIAAFAVQQLFAFGEAAVKAYAQAEKGQLQLLSALNGNVAAQQRLIAQSDELQGKFGIDNDAIVSQQAFLALQGRSEEQIKKTIDAAIQLSAVTGDGLEGSVQKLDATFEGNIGKLAKLDSRFKDLTNTQLANGGAIDLVNEKYKGFAEAGAQSVAGQLEIQQRRVDDLTKSLGEKLGPAYLSLKETAVEALSGIVQAFTSEGSFAQAFNIGQGDVFIKRLKSSADIAKKAYANATDQELQDQITRLNELKKTQTGDDKTQTLGFISGIQALIRERQNQINTETAKEVESLESLKKKLQDLQTFQGNISDPLGAGKGANDANIKEQADIQKNIDEITGKAAEDRRKAAEEAENKRLSDLEAARKREQDIATKAANDGFAIEMEKLEQRKQAVLGAEERSAQERIQIEIDFEEERKKFVENDPVEQAKINTKIAALSRQLNEQKTKDAQQQADEEAKIREKNLADEKTKAEARVQIEQQTAQLIANIRDEALKGLSDNINAGFEERITKVDEEKTAELASIDEKLAANDNARQKDLISLKEFEDTRSALQKERKAAEDKAEKESKALRQQQASAQKLFSLLQIGIKTAEAIHAITAQAAILAANPLTVALAPMALAQIPIVIASGALQAALVSSQKFAKGTKGANAGLSLVGEEGPEFMFVPSAAKILPAGKTKQYAGIIDAMYDNQLDRYLEKLYIGPALEQQKKLFEARRQETFASNVANSFMQTGITAHEMARIQAKGTAIRNVDELGESIAKHLLTGLSQSARRYN